MEEEKTKIPKPLFYYDYLSDESCRNIEKIVKNNFFSKNPKESLIYYNPIKLTSRNDIELPPIKTQKNDYLSSNISKIIKKEKIVNSMSDNHIRKKKPFQRLFKKQLKLILNNPLMIKKAALPKLEKKPPIDRFPIKYKDNYIDNVEKHFINPYLNKGNVIYNDFLENKKSKIPFNFII
jgi:hypothetical protein